MIIVGIDSAYAKGTAIAAFDTEKGKWIRLNTLRCMKKLPFGPQRLYHIYADFVFELREITGGMEPDNNNNIKIYVEKPFINPKFGGDNSMKTTAAMTALSLAAPENTVWVGNSTWKKALGKANRPKDVIQQQIIEEITPDVLEDLGETGTGRDISDDELDAIGICWYGIGAETCCVPDCRNE